MAEVVGITEQNLSLINKGKVKGLRLSILDAICRFLDCQIVSPETSWNIRSGTGCLSGLRQRPAASTST